MTGFPLVHNFRAWVVVDVFYGHELTRDFLFDVFFGPIAYSIFIAGMLLFYIFINSAKNFGLA
jgi:hypothetical protein